MIQPTTSINDLPQANSFSQNSYDNVKFINVNSAEKYDDHIKKDKRIKSKNLKKGCGITFCAPLFQNETLNCRITKDSKLRKRWLAMSRKDFTPISSEFVLYILQEERKPT